MSDEKEIIYESSLQKRLGSLSFAKQLFFGNIDQSKIIPYPKPSLDEKERIDLFCHKLRQFCEAHIDPIEIDKQSKIPDEVIQGLGKIGMLGLTIPATYGGLGMSLTAYCKAIEVIAQCCGSTSAFITAHQSIGYKALLLFGTSEQKQKWLPGIAKGEIIAAFALTEQNAGSDANGVETIAEYDPIKNVFYLTGKKQWITNGSFAKFLTVMAKTDVDTPQGKKKRITAFIVTPDLPGFKVTESAKDKIGMKGIQSSGLEFDHMEVPAENIIGKLGEGLKIALSVLNYGRITIGAGCAGPAKILVDRTFKYARERHQFHLPLSSFGMVKKKLSILTALAYAIDAMTYLTAGKVDQGEKDFMLEAAIVKVFSTEALWKMIFDTMQIFGGKSMFTDIPYELMMRDCRPGMIVEGSNEVMRMFISSNGIKEVAADLNAFLESLKSPISSMENLKNGMKQLFSLLGASTIDLNSPYLNDEAKKLSYVTLKFGRGVVKLIMRYRDQVVDKQIDLERLATIAIDIYATAAVISKIDYDLERVHGKSDLLGRDVEIAKLFCSYTLKDAELNLQSLSDPQDHAIETLCDHLIEDL